jgi:hypothetical protein
MPAAESAARGCSSAASGELRLAPALGARTSWSTILPRPEPTSSSAAGTWGRGCGHGIGGHESSRTLPRRSEHHRSPVTSGKCRRQSRPPLAPRRRPCAPPTPGQRRRSRAQLVTKPVWSEGLWSEHPRREVPLALPGPDECAQVRRGHQPQRMARGLPTCVPCRRSDW